MLRTKRYFGIDKDGEAEMPKDGSSTVKKNGLTCVLLDPRTSFSFVFEGKIYHVRAISTHVVCLVDLFCRFFIILPEYVDYESEI